MTTHYVAAFAPVWGVRVRAVCGDYVAYESHSLEPTCPHCKDLIAKDDAKRDCDLVSIAEVVERY
jgi:hypothetical protein